jgi:peptidoglycan hydrolase CwlO-like protein
METVISTLLEYSPMAATVAISVVVVWRIMKWTNKFYNRMGKTEEEVMSVKADIAIVQMESKEFATKTDIGNIKTDIANIKADIAIMQTESKKFATKTEADIANVKTDIANVKTDIANVKADIASLKENDFYHTNRAILLLAKYLMPKDNVEGFERIKDNCLETTPENRRDEIKSITL